jgi:thiamine pyrophosphate-dependent acetolactate synthase large subunit-like protein/nitrite reductase/ring-hydroxylating ferredoxin subunit
MSERPNWFRALDPDELPEGRVKAVTCGHRTVCMVRYQGAYRALDNRCPHQGGPLGEGSIENGWLRCPWHGWDFSPETGRSPAGLEDGVDVFPTEVREDGVYVGLPDEPVHVRTSTDVMAETMVAWGVKHVFGMVGHSNLGLADAIRRQVLQGNLSYYGIRHEGAASFAVSAYGKLTGRPAACLSIAGPGATNLLTGLWDAHVDRAPGLALTGQVPTQLIGRAAFQEVDLAAAFGGVAKWTGVVQPHSPFAELMTLAVKNAIIRHGPTQLVFPDDVQTIEMPDAPASGPNGRISTFKPAPDSVDLQAAMARIVAARRPVIVVGHGARFAMPAVTELAEYLNAPVVTTFKGKGLISDHHPLGAGVLGRSGTPVASWLVNESDLLVVFGSSFSNHTGIAPYKTIVQVDHDRDTLGRFHPVTVPVYGDIEVTALAMKGSLPTTIAAEDQRPDVAARWAIWRAEKVRRLGEERGRGIASAAVFAALGDALPDDPIIAVDVGNNTYSFGRYFESRSPAVLMSGYLGSIGFGVPAAMGAWAATQEPGTPFTGRRVVAVTGDGGFGQYMGEYATLAKYGMNVVHVLLHNGELGKISKEQRSGDWDVWETDLRNPNFSEFAGLFGMQAERVTQAVDIPGALQRALASDGPALVEVMCDPALV